MSFLSESLGFLLICWGLAWGARLGWKRRGPRNGAVLAMGLSVAVAGVFHSPAWVAGGVLATLGVWGWQTLDAARAAREREGQALIHLHALRGLLRGGLSLPTALFQLVDADPTDLGASLRRNLKKFHKGEQLAACLRQFRERSGIRGAAPLWRILETGYQRGLPLLPALERSLPVLEAEADLAHRAGELRSTAMGQGLVVAALPWGLLAVLGFFQPEVVREFLSAGVFFPTVLGSLALEAVGLAFLWRSCHFARPTLEGLVSQLDLTALYLAAGFDLGYAWAEAGLENWEELAVSHSDPWQRLWFGALRDLYRQGAPIQPLVNAFAEELRKQWGRARESHARQLPTRVNILLILFFLPAAFLLLFVPLLLQLQVTFSP